jgi:hypothetical protein
MCLQIKSKKKPKAKIAKKDIKCYKEIQINSSGIFVSPYRKYEWTFNEIHHSDLDDPHKEICPEYWIINEGFHAFRKNKDCNAKMIIPKGARYYKGLNKRIVSDMMILKKIL